MLRSRRLARSIVNACPQCTVGNYGTLSCMGLMLVVGRLAASAEALSVLAAAVARPLALDSAVSKKRIAISKS